MSSRFSASAVSLTVCALAAFAPCGCALNLGEGSGFGLNPWTRGDAASKRADGGSLSRDEDESDDSVFSAFSWDKISKNAKKLVGQGPNKDLARRLYREADDLFRQALAAEPARRAEIFGMAAPKFAVAADRWPDSQLAMDGLFMAGESWFFADNYPQANLMYEKLVKAFPNNRYLDTVDKRRFAIAKYWLDLNHQSPEPFYYVNYVNKVRPWRDARGHGLRVFDKIRIDDPTGRLADDATLEAANEHFSNGKFWKADEYYTDLRKAYPTSEHQFLAHFLGIKAKLNSYLGPAYGGTSLDETEKLIKQTRRQFPQESLREREFLDRSLAEVRYRKAEQLHYLAEFYDRRAEYRAAEHYYARVTKEFQDTPLAEHSEQRIAQISGLPPKPAQQLPWLVALFPESDKVKPLLKAAQPAPQQAETQVASQPQGTVQR